MLLETSVFSQIIAWQKCYGGSGEEGVNSIIQTPDRGYIMTGSTNSNDFDISNNHGGFDMLVVKTDSAGNIQWAKCYGGSNDDGGYFISKTLDSGYVIAGFSASIDGDVIGNHGNFGDWWIIKIDSVGVLNWQKCLGGSNGETAFQVQEMNNGDFLILGDTWSVDGDVTISGTNGRLWLARTDHSGNILWQKGFGLVAGNPAFGSYKFLELPNGDLAIAKGGLTDFNFIKTDSTGNLLWQKSYGGTQTDGLFDFAQTSDDGFVLIGNTMSNDGDVYGNHSSLTDVWILKVDSLGNIQRQKCIGGSDREAGTFCQIKQTTDGGYLIASDASSNDGDVVGNHGILTSDYWILKLDSLLQIQWQTCLGGPGTDGLYSMSFNSENNLVLSGFTYSNSGNVSGNHGQSDIWTVKLTSTASGLNDLSLKNEFKIYPNPVTNYFQFADNSSKKEIEVYSVIGEKLSISSTPDPQNQYDVSQLVPGIYFVKTSDKGVLKLIKN